MVTEKIPRRKLKTRHAKKNPKKDKKIKLILLFVKYSILFFILAGIFLSILLYSKYIKDLPDVTKLENLEIAESSTIYDRNWEELYKIFKEKRTYIEYEEINPNMVNALVAWEDKRYWTNPWVDVIWIVRAWIYYMLWKTDKVKWTSTLTQQLIRNTIIKNERSIERKVKEIYLAYKLTSWLSKEKILELYLNKISYWHNAFWIEEAAKTFFDKSAKDLKVLESSILASLPKWPTYYSPYNHPDRVVWYLYFFNKDQPEEITEIISTKDTSTYENETNKLKEVIENIKANPIKWTNKIVLCWVEQSTLKSRYAVDSDWCLVLQYQNLLNFLNNIQVADWDNLIEYQTWRKDFILWRMLEDWYITFDQYKNAILEWIWYKFNKSQENIKAAHFIFYVKEYLEQKYWKEIISVWGLKIYTTLDLEKQEKAEELITKYSEINSNKFWADNAALVSLDNTNWDIITMVWGKNYFDEDNKWNVNIVTSKIQPGSTFKPFVYSMWLYENELWSKTPIYDLETNFPWGYSPSNFDWKFMWKMNISTALNNSRNIPAIKMIYLAWWEKAVVSFMQKLWVNSLKNHWMYGAPLALWTWEMTPLELAWAYSVFANLWEKVEINPILKIVDSKWNIIEEKTTIKKEEVISPWQSYIINKMLSDTTTRPAFWNTYLSLEWRDLAAKTWTSTKQYEKNWKKEIYPRNLWTTWYTPQYTTVVWAWNTDWTELKLNWNWLEWAWPIFIDFMKYLHKWEEVLSWGKPSSVKEINISEISWLLPNPEWYNNKLERSLFLNKPTKYDNSYKTTRVDTLCNWVVTDKTPIAAIKDATLLELHSLYPSNANWEIPVQKWASSPAAKEKYWDTSDLITSFSNTECERNYNSEIVLKSNIINNWTYYIWENFLEVAYKSSNPILKVDILINWILNKEILLENKEKWIYTWKLFIPVSYKNKDIKLEIRAVDNQYYSESEIKNISILNTDKEKPIIKMVNPIDSSIKIYDVDFFNLKANISDSSPLSEINLYINWQPLKKLWTDIRLNTTINKTTKLPLWKNELTLEVIDNKWNTQIEKIRVEVLKR